MGFVRGAVLALAGGALGLALASVLAGSASAGSLSELQACNQLEKSMTNADGSIMIAGTTSEDCDHARRISLVRLEADGSVDTGFADGGVVVLGEAVRNTPVVALLPGGSGRILLATEEALLRYLPDGSLDPTFGQSGVVAGVPSRYLDSRQIAAAAVQDDGKVVVAGGSSGGLTVARFGPDGDPDLSFGGDGVVSPAVPEPDNHYSVGAVAFDTQGRVMVAGATGSDRRTTAILLRLGESGMPDPEYGADGDGFASIEAPESCGRYSYGTRALYVDPDGEARIYGSSMYCSFYSDSNLLWEIDPDGMLRAGSPHELHNGGSGLFLETPDGGLVSSKHPGRFEYPSFNVAKTFSDGTDGFHSNLEISPASGPVSSISPAADGSLLIGGAASVRPFTDPRRRMALVRMDAESGEVDTGFGTGGVVIIPPVRCPYGQAPQRAADPQQAWTRCRVKPPTIKGSVRFRHSKSRWPSLSGVVNVIDPPPAPTYLRQKVVVRLPDRLRLRRDAEPLVRADIPGSGEGRITVTTSRRTVTITFTPEVFDDLVHAPVPPSGLLTLRLSLGRGKLKVIPRKHRHRPVRFGIRAAYFPAGPAGPDFTPSRWFGENVNSVVLKARPVNRRN
ncbi:MAG TPA: hypothetical protein VMF31_10140 [Solirubrobacterales bacterium]|nr:hypothetical protein [Solirubrobacterales bacterium]